MSHVVVAGVGMTHFTTPRKSVGYDEMTESAVRACLDDAAVDFGVVQQAYAGYVYGPSAAGQLGLYRLGMTMIPIVNVNNNCSSGASALWLARNAVLSGIADCALAVGFEMMRPGPIVAQWPDRPEPLDAFVAVAEKRYARSPEVPITPFLFGAAGADYVQRWGIDPEVFGRISVKARKHAAMNDRAVFRRQVTLDEVMSSPVLFGPVTRLQACPPTCGAAAVLLCSEDFARHHGIDTTVRILGQGFASDSPQSFDADDLSYAVGYGITERAVGSAYEEAGVTPTDLDVVELHDCFTVNELLSYEALGLTERGTAERFIRNGDNTYGGQVVVNPSGGLLSKGHPLGATGLAQIAELSWQLRGTATGGRQVDDARLAMAHNIGLGGAAVVTVLGVDRAG